MTLPFIIAGLVAVLSAIVMYALFVPKGNNGQAFTNSSLKHENGAIRLVSAIGNEIFDILPEGTIKQGRNKRVDARIESLITRSGNPWNLTAQEFIFTQYLGAFIGFLLSWGIWYVLTFIMNIQWFIVVPLVTAFAFMIPRIKYKEMAKERDLEFKRELPEALDLLIISLSGGRTFTQAMREVVPNMEPSVLKDEFQNILTTITTGRSLNQALDNFAQKAPNESILTFIRSIQTATEANTPLIETLESRAAASRNEFFALLHEKTAQLESKIFMALTPTMLLAAAIVAVAPSIETIMQAFG